MSQNNISENDHLQATPFSSDEHQKFRSAIEFVNQMVQRREALDMTYKDLSEESGIAENVIEGIESFLYFPTDEEQSLLRLALDI